MADPPLFGAVKLTVADPFPAEAVTFVGVDGLPTGVTALEAADAAELPRTFWATALNVYGVPLVNPDTSQPAVGSVVVQVNPPGDEVTTYPVIADPPVLVDAVNVTVALLGEVVVAVTRLGAPGTVAGVTTDVAVDVSDVYAPLFARTVKVTSVPLVRPVTVQPSGVGKVGVITQV
jgi:hypothetical protein